MAVARYLADGSLDPSFGGDGVVTTGFGTDFSDAAGIAVQSDGSVVAAGTAGDDASLQTDDVALARLAPDGSLDPTFGGDGRVTTDFGAGSEVDWGAAVAIQSNGDIVAVGTTFPSGLPCASGHAIAVVRFQADGDLDPSFGSGGKVVTDLSDSDEGNDVLIQADGKIVVAGFTGGYCGNNTFVVVRYLAS